MKLLIPIVVAAGLWAQDAPTAAKAHVLQSVVIDTAEWKMRINVAEGHMSKGEFVLDTLMPEFTVDPDAGTMTDGKVARGFDKDRSERESAWLNHELEVLAKYAAASVKWWNDGKGEPIGSKEPVANRLLAHDPIIIILNQPARHPVLVANQPPPECHPCPF